MMLGYVSKTLKLSRTAGRVTQLAEVGSKKTNTFIRYNEFLNTVYILSVN